MEYPGRLDTVGWMAVQRKTKLSQISLGHFGIKTNSWEFSNYFLLILKEGRRIKSNFNLIPTKLNWQKALSGWRTLDVLNQNLFTKNIQWLVGDYSFKSTRLVIPQLRKNCLKIPLHSSSQKKVSGHCEPFSAQLVGYWGVRLYGIR